MDYVNARVSFFRIVTLGVVIVTTGCTTSPTKNMFTLHVPEVVIGDEIGISKRQFKKMRTDEKCVYAGEIYPYYRLDGSQNSHGIVMENEGGKLILYKTKPVDTTRIRATWYDFQVRRIWTVVGKQVDQKEKTS